VWRLVCLKNAESLKMVRAKRPVARSTERGSVLAAADVKRVQSLLKSKTADGLTLALSLLDSLGATKADHEAVFTDRVISSIVRDSKVSSETVQRWEQLLVVIRGFPRLVSDFSKHATKAVKQRKGFLDLATLPKLSIESAKALAARENGGPAVFALHLDGLVSLDADVAIALAGFRGELWLGGLTLLSPEAARGLAAHKGDSISLNGLRTLSDEAAKALALHRGSGLSLEGLQSLSPSVARALAQYKGNQLGLDGVRTLSDEAATVLLMRHTGWLTLNGLTSLSPTAARVFAKSKRFLRFGGLTTLSLKAAQALAMHRGIVELGVKELDAEAAAALAQFKGRGLDLRELASVPPQALALLQANQDISLPERFRPEEPGRRTRAAENGGRTTAAASSLTDDDARALLGRVGVLEIPLVTTLSDSVAEILSGHKGGSLVLPGVASLSDAAAESLSRHKGPLHLAGLTSLSDVAAEFLGKRTGLLRLDGLSALSDEGAKRLSKHSGYLSLRGLQSLGDRAANSLSAHKGFMNLGSVSHLSEAAAAALSRHSWGMNLQGVHQLSDSAAEHLCRLRFTTTNARGKEIRVTDAVAKQLKAARVRLRRRA
jgi:hypothetical protein